MTTTPQLRSARFRAEREDDWRKLERLIRRVERQSLRALDFNETRELARLYRQALNSLSLARDISLDRNLLEYLEVLSARAYLAVYAAPDTLSGLLYRLFVIGIPNAVRRSGIALLLAFLAMALGAVAGYLLFMDDPGWYRVLVPQSLGDVRGPNASVRELRDVIYDSQQPAMERLASFASFLFSHNTRIAILVFSLGVLACAPAFGLTFYNGLLLGAFFGLHVDRGLGYDIFAWLSIHGVTELSAIIVACAGGVHLGLGVLFPGELRRRDALRHRGRDAVKLAILAAVMLVVAAILEGFFRQTVQGPEARIMIGWGVGFLWVLYFTFVGRRA